MFGRTTTPEMTPIEASRPAAGEVLLDVRGLDEWAAGHAPAAVHLPMEKLRPELLPEATRIRCICRSGNRSSRVVAALLRAGIDAVNVTGGMAAWQAAGLPVVRSDGRPGTVI